MSWMSSWEWLFPSFALNGILDLFLDCNSEPISHWDKISFAETCFLTFTALALLLHAQLGKIFLITLYTVLDYFFILMVRNCIILFCKWWISYVSKAHPTYCHATSQTGPSTDPLQPSICPLTSTHACVPICSTPSPPLRTTNWPRMSGMMWRSTASSTAWRTSESLKNLYFLLYKRKLSRSRIEIIIKKPS